MVPLNVGDKIDNYSIQEPHKKGSFGYVYVVQDLITSSFLALKQYKGVEDENLQRFERENKFLHDLKTHKNIIIPFSEIVRTNYPYLYYVMELADSNLGDYIIINSNLTDNDKLKIFNEVCEGMKHAHNKNIIHRDLHPGNIMIVNGNEIKINDFGLSKNFGSNSFKSKSTVWGFGVKPPELVFSIFNEPTKQESIVGDIYALGIVLYIMFDCLAIYVTGIRSKIDQFLWQRKRIISDRIDQVNISERNDLYIEWLKSFSPSNKPDLSFTISDVNLVQPINCVLRKAMDLNFRLRYQSVDELLIDVKNIIT